MTSRNSEKKSDIPANCFFFLSAAPIRSHSRLLSVSITARPVPEEGRRLDVFPPIRQATCIVALPLFLRASSPPSSGCRAVFQCCGDGTDAETKQGGGDDRRCGIRASARSRCQRAPAALLLHCPLRQRHVGSFVPIVGLHATAGRSHSCCFQEFLHGRF